MIRGKLECQTLFLLPPGTQFMGNFSLSLHTGIWLMFNSQPSEALVCSIDQFPGPISNDQPDVTERGAGKRCEVASPLYGIYIM